VNKHGFIEGKIAGCIREDPQKNYGGGFFIAKFKKVLNN